MSAYWRGYEDYWNGVYDTSYFSPAAIIAYNKGYADASRTHIKNYR